MEQLSEKMNLNQKDIVLLPFPFSDQKGSKVRPALIISNREFNRKCQDCIMIPLTSIIKEAPYSKLIEQKDLSSGRLLKPSRGRLDKIFTINKNLAIIKIGTIKEHTFKNIKSEIIKVF